MSSPFSRRSLYLKRRNQYLLAQLESSSAVLLDRLKKLRGPSPESRNPQCADTGYDSRLSSLKCKSRRKSLHTRCNSGQVLAALNPLYFQNSSSTFISCPNSIDLMPLDVDETVGLLTSPAKRSRRSDMSSHGRLGHESIFPHRSLGSRKKIKVRPRKACPECYCQTSKKQPVTKKQNMKKVGRVCVGCSKGKNPHRDAEESNDFRFEPNSQRKTLEEARTLINYSPESVFLRRLKKRSQIDLNNSGASGTETDQSSVFDNNDREIYVRSKKHSRPPGKSSVVGKGNAIGSSANSVKNTATQCCTKTNQEHDKYRATTSKGNSSHILENSIPPRHTRSIHKPSDNVLPRAVNMPLSKGKITPSKRAKCTNGVGLCRPLIKSAESSVKKHRPNAANKHDHSPISNINKLTATRFKPTQSHKTSVSPSAAGKYKSATEGSTHSKPSSKTSDRRQYQCPVQNKTGNKLKSQVCFKTATSANASFHEETMNKVRLPSQKFPESRALPSKRTLKLVPPTSSSGSRPSSSHFKKAVKASTESYSNKPVFPVEPAEKINLSPDNTAIKSKQRKLTIPSKETGYRCIQDDHSDSPISSYGKENIKPGRLSAVTRQHRNIYKHFCKKCSTKHSSAIVAEKEPDCYHKVMVSPVSYQGKFAEHKISRRKSTRKKRLSDKSCFSHCYCYSGKMDDIDIHPHLMDSERVIKTPPHSCKHESHSQCEWVDELSRYRQSHWFDCHAYEASQDKSTRFSGNEFLHSHHAGTHRHTLNDRLFPVPLSSGDQCISCCRECCGHRNDRIKLTEVFPREITLKSTRNHDNMPVHLSQVPASKSKTDESRTGPFQIYHDPEKQRNSSKSSGCMLTHPIHLKPVVPKYPAPVNSLALRYQKGVV